MHEEKIPLYAQGEYTAQQSDFAPFLQAYLHEDGAMRPAIIVAPGGGYSFLSPSEASLVAEAFYERGFQAYVLVYTVNTLRRFAPVGLQPLRDASRAVCEVRMRAQTDCTDPANVALVGFSAGGHLTASLAVHYDMQGIKAPRDAAVSNRPDACILAYPVISTGEYTHGNTVIALFGENPTESERNLLSLEHHIHAQMPPCFIWHTLYDSVVPVQNSFLFVQACQQAQVPCEAQFYPKGEHGLSVATQAWEDEAYDGAHYVLTQMHSDLRAAQKADAQAVPPEFGDLQSCTTQEFLARFLAHKQTLGIQNHRQPQPRDPAVAQWVATAIGFLNKVWGGIL